MLYWFILWPILLAIILYLIKTKYMKLILLLSQLAFFLQGIGLFWRVHTTGVIRETIGSWPVSVGITLYADSITAVLCLLTIFLFLMMFVFNYHKLYMNKLFMFLFLILQGLINGIFLSNDLFNLYILIEVSTIVVSILIMFKKDSRSIYDGMIYLMTNIVAMTFFLLGIGYLYKIFGSLDLGVIASHIRAVPKEELILPYSLVITAVGLKSAIMPLFSWLPRAHGTPSAPSSVSAILSGLYVKGGVYLLIRIHEVFAPVLGVEELFLIMGFLTGIIGFILALSQTDIKLILAYHTVSQIGLIVFGLNLGDSYSYWGSIYHIVNHAIFKSTLFLTAGMIIDRYQTRDIRRISGVMKELPIVSFVTFLAFLGITGAPFFNGSISKYLIQKGTTGTFYEYGLLIINLGTIMSFIKYMSMFFGKAKLPDEKHIHPVTLHQRIAILVLGLLCFIGGIFGIQFINFFFDQHFSIDHEAYLIKALVYALNVIIGILFYGFAYKRIGLFKKIRGLELSFNSIVMSIVVFFTFVMVYMRFV